ncbi:MAG: transglycosylase, partial [Candidatus Marinimicrobia bacterium]|nr:transglycosylase [Candidatus Neomarinimicrobiota bacterium]
YLSKNRYRYFGEIKDDEKAYLCTICAYNTGPGNVAKALTGTTSLKVAAQVVNQHDTDWVRRKLLKDLTYRETKDYLKRVSERCKMYEGWM